jgi:cob(I)alamin adenosyltransferase
MNEIRNILQSMANNFAQLANEIEKRDSIHQTRIDHLEAEVEKNKNTLRKIANTIIDELEV